MTQTVREDVLCKKWTDLSKSQVELGKSGRKPVAELHVVV